MVVYKYPLNHHKTKINVPPLSKILKVGEIKGELFVWVLIHEELPNTTEIKLLNIATGHDIPNARYIDSIIDCFGYVSHIFELP